jgi:hypothetical protein
MLLKVIIASKIASINSKMPRAGNWTIRMAANVPRPNLNSASNRGLDAKGEAIGFFSSSLYAEYGSPIIIKLKAVEHDNFVYYGQHSHHLNVYKSI